MRAGIVDKFKYYVYALVDPFIDKQQVNWLDKLFAGYITLDITEYTYFVQFVFSFLVFEVRVPCRAGMIKMWLNNGIA